MAMAEPNWTDEELALHVAFERSPRLRRLYVTFDRAMAEPAVARALRAAAHAWLKSRPPEPEDDDDDID